MLFQPPPPRQVRAKGAILNIGSTQQPNEMQGMQGRGDGLHLQAGTSPQTSAGCLGGWARPRRRPPAGKPQKNPSFTTNCTTNCTNWFTGAGGDSTEPVYKKYTTLIVQKSDTCGPFDWTGVGVVWWDPRPHVSTFWSRSAGQLSADSGMGPT